MPVSWIENPRVRGSIPRLATTELNQKAHSSEWAFCYLAFVMEWGGRGILKIFAAGSACRGLHCLPLAIRQGCHHGSHHVVSGLALGDSSVLGLKSVLK